MRHVVKTLLMPDTGICAKNACLRACLSAVQAAQAGGSYLRIKTSIADSS